MKIFLEKFASISIYVLCLFVIIELGVNYFSFQYLFPIKNSTSYGYITKKTKKTIIPLNKYPTRLKAQIALPFELVKAKITSEKELIKTYNKTTKKYGYIDKNGNIAINYLYDLALDFENDYAIVAIKIRNEKKFGTIDKKGNWIIKPKYSYLCPFAKYYTKACLDNKHCGIIDRFGNEITLMTYKTDKLKCNKNNCIAEFCSIGKKNNTSCNYFL